MEKLRKLLAEILERMEKLNSSVKDGEKIRSFTEDEQKQYDDLKAQLSEVRSLIKREEELEEARAEEKRLRTVQPIRVEVTREQNHNEQGEYRGFKELGKGGFGEFMQCVQRKAVTGEEDKRLTELRKSIESRAATGANEGVGADGGYLVQSDHAEKLQSQVVDAGKIASRCTQVPMSTNSTSINLLDETSVAVGSQFGGVQAYWRAEAGSVTSKKPKFRQTNVKAEAMDGLFYATDEQLEDAPQLETFANLAFTTVMAYQLDDAIFNGSGAGKPLGVLNSACLISVAKESAQTADTVNYLNVDKMVDRLLVGSEANALWTIHPDVRQQLRNMVATPGSKTDFMVFLPANGISGKPYDSLLGYPVERSQVCRKLGDLGDIVLADWKQYLLFIRKGIAASQSIHVAFLTGERVFKWTLRANGMPLLNSAITDANGTTTRSAFVALAAR